jgi:hypothetical protein
MMKFKDTQHESAVDHELQCPLCLKDTVKPFFEDTTRRYIRCCSCQLIFVPERYWLSLEDEKATYDLHENSANDPGYRHFLSRLSDPLLEKLQPQQYGLDFGCGPGPTLSIVLEEHGHHVKLYDPFYANNPSVLNTIYDFVCATEVVEHLRNPNKTFTSLFKLVKNRGWLGIMTKLVNDQNDFKNWHYIRDMTHICFYHRDTFLYLAQHFNAKLNFIGNDVILLQNQKSL